MLRKTIITVLLVELLLALGYVEVVYMAPAVRTQMEEMLDPVARALEALPYHH